MHNENVKWFKQLYLIKYYAHTHMGENVWIWSLKGQPHEKVGEMRILLFKIFKSAL
jgi:hypothetical protein